MKGGLVLEGVRKTYDLPGGPLEALKPIDLSVAEGEFVALVGESGCGKSTLLRLIAGLEEPSGGSLRLGGEEIHGPGLDRGVVFQEPRLFPWMTTEANVAFGCPARFSPRERVLSVGRHLELVGLAGFGKAYPSQLSGGMQQRAAIARALVARPRVLLLDEPFGALDALTRVRMQREIARIRRAEKMTMILVTHDIDEAIFLGDRVLVLGPRPGSLKKVFPVKLPGARDRSSWAFASLRRRVQAQFL